MDGSGVSSALAGQCRKPAAADGGDSRAVSAQRADGRLEYPGAAHDEDALALGLSAMRSRVAGGFDLVVVGELNVDVIVDCGDAIPLFGQVDQRVGHLELTLGSSGAITAVAAARLGLRTAIAGVVADDIFGRFVLAELRAAGVDTSACRLRHRGATGATVVLARGTDRAMLTSPGLMGDLAASEVSARLLASARHVHVSSFYLQDRLRAGLPAILAAARSGGATTTLDPGWDPAGAWTPGLDAVLGQLDFFLPNEAEACRITGEDDARAAAARLGGKGRTVVVKRGADGVLVHSGSRAWSLAAASVRPLDSTGAGDNFDAGFIAGLAAGLDIRTACAIGAACGVIATQGYGGTGRTARAGEAWRLASMLLGPAGGSALPAEEQ